MRLLEKSDYRSFQLLNAAQFLGALNDNIFKLLVVYLLINVKGPNEANTILSIAGAIFVLPFLLFSSASGVMADRISKRTIVVFTKFMEVLVMSLGLAAIYYESEIASYVLLFFMGLQSAIFGPSKYGIIPELIEPKNVSKANGSLTALTYLAIIVGTFLASFLTDLTGKNYFFVSLICVVIAFLGFLASLGIKTTEPRNSTKKINPLFVYEIAQTLILSAKRPYLFPAIMGSSFFLFIGAYVQLNVIPLAIQSLGLDEIAGGYLFLATAIGIAIGARIAAALSKDRVEIGMSCLSGFVIVILFFLLSIFSTSLYAVVILLVLLGLFGGIFLIPLEAFIQIASPDKRRGQVIAAGSFLSFVGVLLAAVCLYIFNERLGFTAAGSFSMIGILALIFNGTVSARMSSFFFPYFTEKVLLKFYHLNSDTELPKPGSIIIKQKNSFLDVFMLFFLCKDIKIIMLAGPFERFPWISGMLNSIYLLSPSTNFNTTLQRLFTKTRNLKSKDLHIVLFIPPNYNKEEIQAAYQKIFGKSSEDLIYAQSREEKTEGGILSKKSMVYSFGK